MNILQIYDYYIHQLGDDKNNWWVINTPWPTLTIICIYLYLVCSFIPKYMETKSPYNLKMVIRIYNILQIVSCIYAIYGLLPTGWTVRSMLGCQLVDQSNSPDSLRTRRVLNFLYCLKFCELIETVLFALRKKSNQISILHLYHHTTTLFIGWVLNKYVPGGMSIICPIVNSAVHILMYTYYFLASLGSAVQKKLTVVKSQLTIIQMIQFVFLILHGLTSFRSDCNYSRAYFSAFNLHLAVTFMLFYNFYRKSYSKRTHPKGV